MKITTWICCAYLILFGLGMTLFALSGFDLLLFVTAHNVYAYRALLSLTGVCALWLLFWLLFFKPTKFVS